VELKIWVAVPGDTAGCGRSALASVTLRGKDGGSLRVVADSKNGGGGSLVVGELQWKLAGDLMEGSLELSVDILQQ